MLGISVAETKIPIPWGHISAKIWGDEKDTHVLVFHGIMDNAGSFDHLIPLLPTPFYYICIDLPGHGLSSHFPPHIPIYSLSYLISYKLIADYFKRNRYIIIGHSYGGQIGLLFAQLYPEYVEKIILLDTISLFPVLARQFKSYLHEKFENHLLMEEKLKNGEPPSYTYDEAVEKIQLGRLAPITNEAAMALSHRVLIPTENEKYSFSVDQRTKNFINPQLDFRYIIGTLKEDPVTCPVLIIIAKESTLQRNYMKLILDYLKKMKNVRIKMVKGHHDVHNDYPEVVAPHITAFLLHKKGKL